MLGPGLDPCLPQTTRQNKFQDEMAKCQQLQLEGTADRKASFLLRETLLGASRGAVSVLLVIDQACPE